VLCVQTHQAGDYNEVIMKLDNKSARVARPYPTRNVRVAPLILLDYGLANDTDPVFIAGPGWVMPRLTKSFTSARRFCALPSRVVLSATGWAFPYPYGATTRLNGML
jgi:hypothetical protein